MDEWNLAIQWFKGHGISHFAPSLTHLQLSQLEQDKLVITHFECALGLRIPHPTFRITQLPTTIEFILIKPAVAPPPSDEECPCCDQTAGYLDKVNGAACR
jgi:hypothetical protein